MTDEIDFGTDRAADKAATQIAETSPCAGGCGKSWQEAGGGWRGFMALDGDKTCVSPVWHCDPCMKAKDAAEWAASQALLPEHVQVLRQQEHDLAVEIFGAGLARLLALSEKLAAAYEECGHDPRPKCAPPNDEPQVH